MPEKYTCTGCGTCALRCPAKAICMNCDKEGFRYPHIDTDKCVNCGLCDKVCHLNTHNEMPATRKVYAAVNKDLSRLKQASSGGVFSSVAEFVLERKGVCYGVCLCGTTAEYLRVCDRSELGKLFGSKYVQADNQNTFGMVENDCEDGKCVLFVGTPCLVAGLKQYLKKDYENLYTIDIVCHGAPSKLYFEKYIEYIEHKLNGRVSEFSFRDKSKYGVGCISSCILERKSRKKKIVLTNQLLNYYYFYMFADSYRESCYLCKYTDLNRVADITLGDFWGIEKLNSELDISRGCSAVLVNSPKGEMLLQNAIEKHCNLEEHTIEDILVRNTALKSNTARPVTRNTLYGELAESGFEGMITDRYKPSVMQYTKGIIKRILPLSIQKFMHRYK